MRRRAAIATIASSLVPARRRADAQNLPVIKVMGPPVGGFKATYYGVKAGIFTKYGINVQPMLINSGAAAVAALTGGEVDVALTNITTVVNAHVRNIPIQIIAPGALFSSDNPLVTGVLVRKDSPIQSGRDLNGATVASVDLDATAAAGIKAWAGKSGGDISTIKFIEAPSAVAVQMLEDGRVQVAVVNEPAVTDALSRGKVRVAADPMAAIANHFLLALYAVMIPAAEQKADAMRRFAQAMHEAQVYVNGHLPETAELVSSYTKIAPEVVAKSQRIIDAEYASPDILQPIIDALAKYTEHGCKTFPARDLISPYALVKK